jgi:hypothetical protein
MLNITIYYVVLVYYAKSIQVCKIVLAVVYYVYSIHYTLVYYTLVYSTADPGHTS